MMELDPKYVDMITLRYAASFGEENIFLERSKKVIAYSEIMR